MRQALTGLVVAGRKVDLSKRVPHPVRPVRLPNYPWQKGALYHTPKGPMDRVPKGNLLLGDRLNLGEALFAKDVTLRALPFLPDHKVRESVLFLAAGFFEMAVAAGRALSEDPSAMVELHHVRIAKALRLNPSQAVVLQTFINRRDNSFAVESRIGGATNQPFDEHVAGLLTERPHRDRHIDLDAIAARMEREHAIEAYYAATTARGLHYGPRFQTVHSAKIGNGEGLIELRRHEAGARDHHLDPTMVDGALQALIDLASAEDGIVAIDGDTHRVLLVPDAEARWREAQSNFPSSPLNSSPPSFSADNWIRFCPGT